MNNADLVEQIAERFRDLQERLNAWEARTKDGLSAREVGLLNLAVEDELAQVRAPLAYREHVDEFRKELDNAIDDGALIQRLYEEIFLRAKV